MPAMVFTGLHCSFSSIQRDVDKIIYRIRNPSVMDYVGGDHSLHAEFPDRFVSGLSTLVKGLAKGGCLARSAGIEWKTLISVVCIKFKY